MNLRIHPTAHTHAHTHTRRKPSSRLPQPRNSKALHGRTGDHSTHMIASRGAALSRARPPGRACLGTASQMSSIAPVPITPETNTSADRPHCTVNSIARTTAALAVGASEVMMSATLHALAKLRCF